MLADGTTVIDEYDPDLGILLGQDLDFHFDRFQMSLYVTVILFKNDFLTSRKITQNCIFSALKHILNRQISFPRHGMREVKL